MRNNSKKHGIVWYILMFFVWVIALPIMLSILLYKKGVISKKIAIIIGIVGTLIWGVICSASAGTNNTEKSQVDSNSYTSTSDGTTNSSSKKAIKGLSFNKSDDITVKVGQIFSKPYTYYLKVSVAFGERFTPEDIVFVSENPNIATIAFSDVSGTSVRYTITGVSEGETFVYATSTDENVSSEKIKVVVPKPIEAESVSVEYGKADLAIGETIKPKVEILPSNTEIKTLSWTSSDDNVVSVDTNGVVEGKADGTATITATTSNGLSQSVEFSVDGSKHLMKLKTSQVRTDDNNIGDEWSYQKEINGERPQNTIAVSAGETLRFWARFSEDDDNPDVGETSTSYVVSEDDIINGFSVSMNLSVRENGGKNSGKTADFEITFTFTPYDK